MRNRKIRYRERLWVPLRWWAQWTFMVATFWLAMIVAIPEALAWLITTIMMLLLSSLLLGYGSVKIVVTEEWLRAGRAQIPLRHLAAPRELDASGMWATAGPDADARAYLLLRPYIHTGVRIEVSDSRDPTPYWLVSSRRPALLAAALIHGTTGLPDAD